MSKLIEWRLHAQSREFARKVDEARRVIERALSTARFVISWSTGKDSTAMAHLIRSVNGDVPIMIQFDDCDWPEKRPYADRVCAQLGWTVHSVEPDFSVWEAACGERIGFDNICAQSHQITRDGFLKPLNTKMRELGGEGVFLGLRIEESRARKLNLASRGPLYRLKDGTWRSCPLWRWTARDVFAYLVSQGIEINPCYLHNRFKKPEDIRLCWALPTPTGRTTGDLEHLRYYYPAQFARLRDEGIV